MTDETQKPAQDPSVDADPVYLTIPQKIDAWFADHFQNSMISRGSVEVYNFIQTAKEDLKKRFGG